MTNLAIILGVIAVIQTICLILIFYRMANIATLITQLLDAFDKVLATDASNKVASDAALVAANKSIDELTAQESALNDPALQARMQTTLANLSAAAPPEDVPTPNPTPNP